MPEAETWQPMRSAPKDGTRILVTVRSMEQGPAEVDVAYWARADQFAIEGWRAVDSSPGCVIAYAEPELVCWMPLPQAAPGEPAGAMPRAFEGEPIELDGSGI